MLVKKGDSTRFDKCSLALSPSKPLLSDFSFGQPGGNALEDRDKPSVPSPDRAARCGQDKPVRLAKIQIWGQRGGN